MKDQDEVERWIHTQIRADGNELALLEKQRLPFINKVCNDEGLTVEEDRRMVELAEKRQYIIHGIERLKQLRQTLKKQEEVMNAQSQ